MIFMFVFTLSYNSSNLKYQDRTQIMTKKGDRKTVIILVVVVVVVHKKGSVLILVGSLDSPQLFSSPVKITILFHNFCDDCSN